MSNFLSFLSGSNAASEDLSILGGILQFTGAIQQGRQTQDATQYQADQLRINGGQAQASAQRTAADVDRQTQMVVSRALAVAASSGGGASDPTVVNLIAQNAAEGAYRKAVALYGGDEANRVDQAQASAKEYEGKAARASGNMMGAANLLMAGAKTKSLYQRLNGNTPPPGQTPTGGPGTASWGMDLGRD
jgi:hypothetical protein